MRAGWLPALGARPARHNRSPESRGRYGREAGRAVRGHRHVGGTHTWAERDRGPAELLVAEGRSANTGFGPTGCSTACPPLSSAPPDLRRAARTAGCGDMARHTRRSAGRTPWCRSLPGFRDSQLATFVPDGGMFHAAEPPTRRGTARMVPAYLGLGRFDAVPTRLHDLRVACDLLGAIPPMVAIESVGWRVGWR